ncbi:uncharacterized protein PAC_12182 [Phialocephala subalpina]|uniref:Uncharacterized protein n=1 Tax=Phialocephala subalpina TaxID=576137 RepID=A0A1L7XB97_9HELO|nr:uncharacterized protein PAC_12182 [Phialocephala subalpina]
MTTFASSVRNDLAIYGRSEKSVLPDWKFQYMPELVHSSGTLRRKEDLSRLVYKKNDHRTTKWCSRTFTSEIQETGNELKQEHRKEIISESLTYFARFSSICLGLQFTAKKATEEERAGKARAQQERLSQRQEPSSSSNKMARTMSSKLPDIENSSCAPGMFAFERGIQNRIPCFNSCCDQALAPQLKAGVTGW